MSETAYVDEWWEANPAQAVNSVALGIAHHHATGHTGSGSDSDYSCGVCDFVIVDGHVLWGGFVRFAKADS